MTQCCNQLDVCYDTCGTSKYDCDSKFRLCLHGICSDLNKSLGFVNRVQGEIFAHIFPFSPMCTVETEVWIWLPEINSLICYSALLLSLFLCSPQPVKRWPTLYSTQCGLWVVDPTWTARGQRVSARERRGMNCDTQHYGLLGAYAIYL